MKTLIIEPAGWLCPFKDCPPGPFVYNETLCFKSEYHTADGLSDAYNSAGEFFSVQRENILVQPVRAVWQEIEV